MAQLTVAIDDNKMADFKTCFLEAYPVPTDSEGDPSMSENH